MFLFKDPLIKDDLHPQARVLDGTSKHGTTCQINVVLKSRLSRAQFSLVRHNRSASFAETGLLEKKKVNICIPSSCLAAKKLMYAARI